MYEERSLKKYQPAVNASINPGGSAAKGYWDTIRDNELFPVVEWADTFLHVADMTKRDKCDRMRTK